MPAFDTHKAVKALCSAGFDDAQAEAVVEQIGGAFDENIATKTDIQGLATKEELRQQVGHLDTRLDRLDTKLDNAVERFELRLAAELEKQATRSLKSIVVVAAAFVGLSKALDLLVG